MNQQAVTTVLTSRPTGIVHTCTLLLTAHAWLMIMTLILARFDSLHSWGGKKTQKLRVEIVLIE